MRHRLSPRPRNRLARLAGYAGFGLVLAAGPLVATAAPLPDNMHIEAVHLDWDGDARTLTAQGDVRVLWDGNWLQAESVRLAPDQHRIEAEGNVRWGGADGRGAAGAVTFDTEARTGLLFDARIDAPDGSRIEGRRIARTAPDRYEVEDGLFTPCSCPEGVRTTWQIEVGKAVVDWRESVRFRHAVFRLWGAPVLWAPAGWLPLTESRTTGLLTPRVGYGRRYGLSLEPGVFVTLGPSADLTLFGRVVSAGGWGGRGELRGRTRTGSHRLGGDVFFEAADADYVRSENRDASARWRIDGRVDEHPWQLFRLQLQLDLLGDRNLDADFAGDLNALTRQAATSRLELSRELDGVGAGIARVAISQSLLNAQNTGSRTPSLRFRGDPWHLPGIPLWLSADMRFDQFSFQDPQLGRAPWDPRGLADGGRRFVAGPRAGLRVDPLPGLHVQSDAGIWFRERERTLHDPATGNRREIADDRWLPWNETRLWYGLQFRAGDARALLRPGVDLLWRGGSTPATTAIEDLDALDPGLWATPTLRAAGELGRLDWDAAYRQPIRRHAGDAWRVLGVRSWEFGLGGAGLGLQTRLLYADGAGPAAGDLFGHWQIVAGQRIELGYARTLTGPAYARGSAWHSALPTAWADDPGQPVRSHDLAAGWRFRFWQFDGALGTRLRLPMAAGDGLQWVERSGSLTWRDRCDCWAITLSAQDLPGDRADRIDLRFDFAVLGGFGTGD